jgi:surface polysaccharide O-acyltransferase-like enzyme
MKAKKREPLAPLVSENPLKGKINYIDHLKILLTVLVVLHHSFITYGAAGSWYFQQKTTSMAALFPMTVFVATNQSFFMGFFFFLSALFIEPSYQKKGAALFIKDRLVRLGIPLIFYSLVLSPVLNYIVEHYGYGQHHSFIEYMSGYHHWIDFGVMWFVAALLIFNFIYVGLKSMPSFNTGINSDFLPNNKLLLAAALLGLFTFITRLAFPTGWTLFPFGFQLGHFPQYILLFIMGIVASKNKWLNQLNLKQGKNMARRAVFMVLLVLPMLFTASLITKTPGQHFAGGWNIFAFSYSLWEQLTGIMIMTALLCIASVKWNTSSPFLRWLSANVFAVYIFHPLVLITLSLLIKSWDVDPVVKLAVVAPSAVVLSFLFASAIRKIPYVSSVI